MSRRPDLTAPAERQFLTRREVASEYPISLSSLAHMALKGLGPAYSIVGKKAVYTRKAVEDWIAQRQVDLSERRAARQQGKPRPRGRPPKPAVRQSPRGLGASSTVE